MKLLMNLKKYLKKIKFLNLRASRKESKESFIICKLLR